MELAQRKFGWTVERRRVAYKELSQFAEVAACGTAVIITPVSVISRQVLKPEAKVSRDLV